jgi:hypothetical protein
MPPSFALQSPISKGQWYYIKMRVGSSVRDCAVLMAIGIHSMVTGADSFDFE